MRKAAVLAGLAALVLGGVAVAGDGKMPWVKDFDQALALAQKTGKPLMVNFSTSW